MLSQAAGVQATADGSYEMFDYVISLREGIMDAWGGIIGAMKSSNKGLSRSPAKTYVGRGEMTMLTWVTSRASPTLRRDYLRLAQHGLVGPEPQ